MGSKQVNFDKLFLHQMSIKIYQSFRDDVYINIPRKCTLFAKYKMETIFVNRKTPVGGIG